MSDKPELDNAAEEHAVEWLAEMVESYRDVVAAAVHLYRAGPLGLFHSPTTMRLMNAVGRLIDNDEVPARCTYCKKVFGWHLGVDHVQGLEDLCDCTVGVCCRDCRGEFTLHQWYTHEAALAAHSVLESYRALSQTPYLDAHAAPQVH